MPQFQFLVQCIVCKLQYTISDYPEVIAEEALDDRYSYCSHCRMSTGTFSCCQSQYIIIKHLHQSGLSSIVLDAASPKLIIPL